MTSAILLDVRQQFAAPSVSDLLRQIVEQFAFLDGKPKPPAAGAAVRLQAPTVESIEDGLLPIITQIIMGALNQRTAAEFDAYREAHFKRYSQTLRALSDAAGELMTRDKMFQKSRKSFEEAEMVLRDRADSVSEPLREQALFTIWNFRKIDDQLRDLFDNKPPEDLLSIDRKLASEFAFMVILARFHFECVVASACTKRRIAPDVEECILDGMRAAVNAYAIARQGARLRRAKVDRHAEERVWDDEDKALLAASMRDGAANQI